MYYTTIVLEENLATFGNFGQTNLKTFDCIDAMIVTHVIPIIIKSFH